MNIELTEKDLAVIGKALSLLPYVEVFRLIEDLNKQVNSVAEE